MKSELFQRVDQAVSGDKEALHSLIAEVQDPVFNLSLRMLGNLHDAQDATQEVLIKIITQLSTFRKESAFSTWVYRIAANYLMNCKKSMFAKQPLSFDFFAQDIKAGFIPDTEDLRQNVEQDLLAEELKLSCTNVMLQCLSPDSRCIYVLGIMFRVDSITCGEILGITPEAYRQRLSRIRKKVAGFLGECCGLSGAGVCDCKKRVSYAVQTHRLNPKYLEYSQLRKWNDEDLFEFQQAMEEMDALSLVFAELPKYRAPQDAKAFLQKLLLSKSMGVIRAEG